jgi:hypothetical protein
VPIPPDAANVTTPDNGKRKASRRVSAKIAHLIHNEKKPRDQAIAMAYSMEEAGKLGPKGGYNPKGK